MFKMSAKYIGDDAADEWLPQWRRDPTWPQSLLQFSSSRSV